MVSDNKREIEDFDFSEEDSFFDDDSNMAEEKSKISEQYDSQNEVIDKLEENNSVNDKENIDEIKVEKPKNIPTVKKQKKVKDTSHFKTKEEAEKRQSIKKIKKQDETTKKLISISSKNRKVLDILKEVNKGNLSDSDYICQAIIEKYEREQSSKPQSIKDLVRQALDEMVGENYVLFKGSGDIGINVNQQYIPQEASKVKTKQELDKSEELDLIKGALDLWDE